MLGAAVQRIRLSIGWGFERERTGGGRDGRDAIQGHGGVPIGQAQVKQDQVVLE
eukprot:CAMPEP_0174900564 /NCGR_PEP_ID=MMETSP0167-20121228/31801_1 /TAXON_ID=38298 /ORGANISM="Rhodella maculata, Strain CCMP736" /LENGTH=53 /DNA_ID=CAMNT_0016141987 /DNA_START=209 /DNA_END=371 /DNA_ORIENTATION=+